MSRQESPLAFFVRFPKGAQGDVAGVAAGEGFRQCQAPWERGKERWFSSEGMVK